MTRNRGAVADGPTLTSASTGPAFTRATTHDELLARVCTLQTDGRLKEENVMLQAGALVVATRDHGGVSRLFVQSGDRGVVTQGGWWPVQVRWQGRSYSQPAYVDEIA